MGVCADVGDKLIKLENFKKLGLYSVTVKHKPTEMGYSPGPPNQAELPAAEKERLEENATKKQPDIARFGFANAEDEISNFVKKFIELSNEGNIDNLLEVYADRREDFA